MKLNSCMTLFSCANPNILEFQAVLEKYFEGIRDEHTLRIIKNHLD